MTKYFQCCFKRQFSHRCYGNTWTCLLGLIYTTACCSQSAAAAAAFFSRFSGFFGVWLISVTRPREPAVSLERAGVPQGLHTDTQQERRKRNDKASTGCCINENENKSVSTDTGLKTASTSLLQRLRHLKGSAAERRLLNLHSTSVVWSWGWHARPHRMPPVELTASRLFVQMFLDQTSRCVQFLGLT